MSPDAPPEKSSRRRGSRRRFLLTLSALCPAVIVGLLLYDVPLKPYDDMMPVAEEAPNPGKNGFLYLKRAWENVEEMATQDRAGVAKITSRALPWDDALAAKAWTGRETVTPALRHAAALPRWVPSLEEREDRGRWTTSAHSWMYHSHAIVALEACAAARAGDAETAFEIWRAQHTAATRQIAGSLDVDTLLAGQALRGFSGALACDLLEWLPEDTALQGRLEEHWREDPCTNAVAAGALGGELRWLRTELDRSGPLHEELGSLERPAAARWLVKKNMTMNRCAALVRVLEGGSSFRSPHGKPPPPPPSNRRGETTGPVSLNYFGNRMVKRWTFRQLIIFQMMIPGDRFLSRAMRVRLALQRWRLARGGDPSGHTGRADAGIPPGDPRGSVDRRPPRLEPGHMDALRCGG